MQFNITNRFTSAVQVTADIECGDDASYALKLGLAVRWALKSSADLGGAYLRGAYLRGAYLRGADLRGADLGGAYLRSALLGADKLQRIVARAVRNDGYDFILFALEAGAPKIRAGCRCMTIADYRQHIAREYPGSDRAAETGRMLDYFEACLAATLTQGD